MNAQELLAAGYSKFQDHLVAEHLKPQYAYQKKVYNSDHKTLYFINVYEYNWREFKPKHTGPDFSYEVKINLYVDEKADCLRIEFTCNDFTIEELEEYVDDLYFNIDCVPDKLN